MRNILIILFLSISTLGFAQRGIPDPPREEKLVNDFTKTTLSQREINALENKLLGYEDSTSTQVAILIVESLNGYEVVDFAQRTGQKWGVGTAKDNGVFIVVSINDRKAAIVTGYGMEGSITDAATFTIREEYMNPQFKEGRFYQGLDDATDVIFKLASGEYKAEQFAQNRKSKSSDGKGFPFVTLFILFFFIIPAIVGRRRRGGIGSRGIPWWVWLMMGSGGHRRRDDDWDNFRGGGGMFGGGGSGFGGGGGGFGGFGGGSFGGGGSGGSW
ncbi:TPM domain-containing protein [Roseivirga sp.]|uniref:TPM domain-containing protein n=1 Tax=Roseivirga sp. TaxID=1964215 RepID=UPI003B51F854